MRIRRNTDSNNQLKPCISVKRPTANVVVDDEAAFFTDVTHSISHDSDFPSYDEDDSTGDHLVMLSTVRMIKESQSMASVPMEKSENGIVAEKDNDEVRNSAIVNIEMELTDAYFAQLKGDFHLSRTRMHHVLAELRQFHQRRARKERPRRTRRTRRFWMRVLFVKLTLFVMLRLASHLVPVLSALFHFDRPNELSRTQRIESRSSCKEISPDPSPPRNGLDLNLLRFIEYHRPA